MSKHNALTTFGRSGNPMFGEKRSSLMPRLPKRKHLAA